MDDNNRSETKKLTVERVDEYKDDIGMLNASMITTDEAAS